MTENKTPYYLEQVRNELVKFGVKREIADKVSFCKVTKIITEENLKTDFASSYIADSDSPTLGTGVKFLWIPLCITTYPKVLASMTANQAGYYALKKCREQRWPHSDYDCCLAN
ncbi:MAG: hypothetical protein K5829_03490, partial [Treponema sp.]|nr:hypothetical protein [Treponema sp.]